MENKKIDVLFGLVVIAFLVVTFMLLQDIDARRTNDIKEYSATLVNIVEMKNNKIKSEYTRFLMEQKENEDLKNTLAQTRNDLDTLSKKLAQQAALPPAAPVAVSAPAPVAVSK